ncbi:MAG: 23S rRNA (pseudouridine(1915)-N(3))-methyltransferase RlmH [Flavobacteriales bacterium]
MNIKIVAIGKTSTPYIKEGLDVYFKRLKHYVKTELIEIPDVHYKERDRQKEKEGEAILKHIKSDDLVFLLDEKGDNPSSRELANFFQKKMNAGTRQMVLVIGGAFGFSPELYDRANGLLSFSKMTFSHEMIRLFLLEQIYRSYTILKGESYHND